MEEGRPANQLRICYDQHERESKQLNECLAKEKALIADHQQQNNELKQLNEQYEPCVAKLESLREERSDIETLIVEEVIPLDKEIELVEKQADLIRQDLQPLKQALKEHESVLSVTSSKINQSKNSLAQLNQYLSENIAHQKIGVSLTLWQSQLTQRLNYHQNLKKLKFELHKSEADLALSDEERLKKETLLIECKHNFTGKEQSLLEATNQLEMCLQGESLEVKTQQYLKALDSQKVLEACQRIYQNFTEASTELSSLQHQQKQNEDEQRKLLVCVDTLRNDYQNENKLLKEIERNLALEQQIKSLESYREKLQLGDACPLCGSEEHPAIDDYQIINSSETELRRDTQKEKLLDLTEKGQEAKESLVRVEEQVKLQAERILSLTTLVQNYHENWSQETIKIECNKTINDPVIPAFFESTANSQIDTINRYQEITKYDAELKNIKASTERDRLHIQTMEHELELFINNEKNRQQLHHSKLVAIEAEQSALENVEQALETDLHTNFTNAHGAILFLVPEVDDQAQWLDARSEELKRYQQNSLEQESQTQSLNELVFQEKSVGQQVLDLKLQIQKTDEAITQKKNTLQQITLKRTQLFGEKSVSGERERLLSQYAAQEEKVAEVKNKQDLLYKINHTLEGQISQAKQERVKQKDVNQETESIWLSALDKSIFKDESHFKSALLSEHEFLDLDKWKTNLDTEKSEASALQHQAQQHLEALKSEALSEFDELELNAQSTALIEAISLLNKQQGEINQTLKLNTDQQCKQQSLKDELVAGKVEYDDWAYLNSLIGSADGKRFRVFAQGLTLDYLIHLANQQLVQLHARYQLARKPGEALELEVIDTWQADSKRDTKTLSGGESFLVSLALALALSDLVSHKTRIDSLFLDEGFGTLDRETLDIALDALDNLNASGKMIGVISHVDALKERIAVQVEIKKMSGLGVSQLQSKYQVN